MIPNLPTDSLYKFIAVAGLVTFVTGAILTNQADKLEWQWENSTPSIESQIEDLDRRSKIYSEKQKRYLTRIDEAKTKRNKLQTEAQTATAAAFDAAKNTFSQPEVSRLLEDAEKKSNELANETQLYAEMVDDFGKQFDLTKKTPIFEERNSINDKQRALIIQIKESTRLNLLGPSLMLLGMLFSISGFSLWYHRVQKYTDILLKRQAEEEEPTKNPLPTDEEKGNEE